MASRLHRLNPTSNDDEARPELREFGAAHANQAVALMREGQVIDVGLNRALNAAANGLPMADGLIYATAQAQWAILWTQDQHFEGLPGVRYLPKNSAA